MSKIDHVGRVHAQVTGDMWHVDRDGADILISPDGVLDATVLTPVERNALIAAIVHVQTRDTVGGRATDPPSLVIADSDTEWQVMSEGDRMLVSRGGTREPTEFTRAERDELLRVLIRSGDGRGFTTASVAA